MSITYNDYNIRTTDAANLAMCTNSLPLQPILSVVGSNAPDSNWRGAIAFPDNITQNPTGRVNLTTNITGLRIYPGNMSSDQGVNSGGPLETGRCYAGIANVGSYVGIQVWNNVTNDRRWELTAGSSGSAVVMNFSLGISPPDGTGPFFTEGRWLSREIECARLLAGGNFLVNCTQLFFSAEARLLILSPNDTTAQILLAPSWGSGTFRTTLAYRDNSGIKAAFQVRSNNIQFASLSDHRLKTNIEDLTGARDMVDRLRPITFHHIDDSDDDLLAMGFIAHEVQEVYPLAVFGERDAVDPDTGKPRLQNMDSVKLIPMLVAAAKELRAEIQSLENQLGIA